ncbi:hypothetical protein COU74_00215 [Candidatus Peregrinibacteria bacterium CG10_big_fil_rev_8_21_14_0_10_36_19]|nr:MAG: hypothetical protein COU74_00215 [Candidatus Peregrinibacteria bacterium CG10_big_fil_rev_8_21_14_0_10_36_19]
MKISISYFNNMTSKIIKSTERGQITLPKQWRSQFNTDNFLLKIVSNKIIITPVTINDLENEEIIFDADRDNKGKGIGLNEMLEMLKQIDNE